MSGIVFYIDKNIWFLYHIFMDNYINSDLIRGNIDTIILRSLSEGDKYGYEILKEIETKTQGEYILKQPTLYSCLKRLEQQGYISSFWGQVTMGGRRKYYRLTPEGKEYFEKVQADWEYSRALIDKLIAKRRNVPQDDNQLESQDDVQKYDLDEDDKAEKIDIQSNDAFAPKNHLSSAHFNQESYDKELDNESKIIDNEQVQANLNNDTQKTKIEADTDNEASNKNDLNVNQEQEQPQENKKQIFIVAKSKSDEDSTKSNIDNTHPNNIPIYTPLKGKPLYAKSERVLADLDISSDPNTSQNDNIDHKKEFSPKAQTSSNNNDTFKTNKSSTEQISFFKSIKPKEDSIDNSLIGKTRVNYNADEVFFANQLSNKTPNYKSYEDLMLQERMELFKENITKHKKASQPKPSLDTQLYTLPDNSLPDFNDNVTPAFGGTYGSIEEAQQAFKIEKQYKNVLGKLFENKNNNGEIKIEHSKESTLHNQTQNNKSNNYVYDFNEIKVVPYSKNVASDYYSSYYVYYNKFKLAQYLIFSLLLLLMDIGLYFLVNVGFDFKVNIGYFYAGGLVAALFALFAILAFFYKPNRKKRMYFEIGKELLKKFYLWLILSAVFVLTFYLVDNNLFSSIANLAKALIAIILSLNILSLPIISKIMLKFKAFSVKS